jgi:hypothetical protein
MSSNFSGPEAVVAVLGVVALIIVLGLLFTLPVMWLMNWLLATFLTFVFGVTHVGFWQAWGISTLCSFLFKSTSVKSGS